MVRPYAISQTRRLPEKTSPATDATKQDTFKTYACNLPANPHTSVPLMTSHGILQMFFLDVLELVKNSVAWYAVITVDGKHDIKFKLDIEANVIVIPRNRFKQLTPYSSTNTDACLSSVTSSAWKLCCKFEVKLIWRSKWRSTEISVAENLRIPLLRRRTIEALGIIP